MSNEEQYSIFWETIEILNKADLLPHLIIIGSWAEYVYSLSYFNGYLGELRTTDLDFLVPNVRHPRSKIDVINLLEENGFVTKTSVMTGVTKFYKGSAKGGSLEVEFLVRELCGGQTEAYDVPSLGIKSVGLPHLEVLSNHTITLNMEKYLVKAPRPQAYILHKMLIKRSKEEKTIKDLRSVLRLLRVMGDKPYEMGILEGIFNSLTKKQKKRIKEVCQERDIELAFL